MQMVSAEVVGVALSLELLPMQLIGAVTQRLSVEARHNLHKPNLAEKQKDWDNISPLACSP